MALERNRPARSENIWQLNQFDWKQFAFHLWERSDTIMAQSAQLSFYLVFALFPFLLFLTALLGYLLETQAVLRDLLEKQLIAVAPGSVVTLLEEVLQDISKGATGGKLSFGLVFSLWTASSGMAALIVALNTAYAIKEARAWWKRRAVALAMTIGFLLMSLFALALLVHGPNLIDAILKRVGVGLETRPLWELGRWLFILVFLLLAFNLLYVFGPNVKHREWHWLMPGTLFGLFLWLAVSFAFKLYLSQFDRFSATYGSIGGVMILLLWLYLSGIAVILGGELNSAIEQQDGKLEEKEKEPA